MKEQPESVCNGQTESDAATVAAVVESNGNDVTEVTDAAAAE